MAKFKAVSARVLFLTKSTAYALFLSPPFSDLQEMIPVAAFFVVFVSKVRSYRYT